MDDNLHLPVTDPSEVGQARRAVSAFSRRLGFDETEAGKAAIIVTELGTNLIKHAGGGELFARALPDGVRAGLEILAIDHGPGVDTTQSLRDGFSTAGTAGQGLGAVSRLSTFFDIYSNPGAGTVVLTELWPGDSTRGAAEPFDIGAVAVAKDGEPVSGDTWSVFQRSKGMRLILADGLGHGLSAADASREAINTFSANPDAGPEEMLQLVHAALKKTRGAAVAIADINLEKGLVTYAGLGNISGVIVMPGAHRNLVSHNGTAGHEARKIAGFTYPWSHDSILVMHSDGLSSRWGLDDYRGLSTRCSGIIAAQIYADLSRGRDDATVLVAREKS